MFQLRWTHRHSPWMLYVLVVVCVCYVCQSICLSVLLSSWQGKHVIISYWSHISITQRMGIISDSAIHSDVKFRNRRVHYYYARCILFLVQYYFAVICHIVILLHVLQEILCYCIFLLQPSILLLIQLLMNVHQDLRQNVNLTVTAKLSTAANEVIPSTS